MYLKQSPLLFYHSRSLTFITRYIFPGVCLKALSLHNKIVMWVVDLLNLFLIGFITIYALYMFVLIKM